MKCPPDTGPQRDRTVDALRAEGHLVLGLDCAEALPEQASWRRVDLMVVDLNLPGEDELALTQRLRSIQTDAEPAPPRPALSQ